MRKLTISLLALLLLAALTLPSFASFSTMVIDHGGMLSSEERARLENDACNCRFGDLHPYLITYGNVGQAPDADTILRRLGLDWDSDAIVLCVREYQGTYYYDMYTFGRAMDMFSAADIDTVLDAPDVFVNLKAGRVYDGYRAFYSECHRIVSNYTTREYEAAQAREKRAPFMALLFGAISGLVVAGVTVLCVFLSYRKKRHGESYPLDRYARLHLTDKHDIFVGSYVTRVRVQSSSSGGGRSGGGGGGGGHRGGR